LLRAAAITKRFGRTLALDRVDFEARPSEIHALVGENGAGKTTLMNVLAGALSADSGETSLDGKILRAGSRHAALRAGIATVHQSPMLFERMSWRKTSRSADSTPRTNGRPDAVAAAAREFARNLGSELPAPTLLSRICRLRSEYGSKCYALSSIQVLILMRHRRTRASRAERLSALVPAAQERRPDRRADNPQARRGACGGRSNHGAAPRPRGRVDARR
jgi:ABC-type branched-subunit amino acid transport system ATPase component